MNSRPPVGPVQAIRPPFARINPDADLPVGVPCQAEKVLRGSSKVASLSAVYLGTVLGTQACRRRTCPSSSAVSSAGARRVRGAAASTLRQDPLAPLRTLAARRHSPAPAD